jgi:hypothetical protein
MAKVKDITGQRFGRLLVHLQTSHRRRAQVLWVCKCDCGSVVVVERPHRLKSCGCLRREKCGAVARDWNARRLGTADDRRNALRATWYHMIKRCTDRKDKAYRYYGARGITVCSRWLDDFENFFADMGHKPDGRSLDRINNDGNYEPSNCRWATRAQQNNNTRRNVPYRFSAFRPLLY